MITSILLVALVSGILSLILTLRMVDNDEHYGLVGLGGFAQSAANTFSKVRLDDGIISPNFIYSVKNKSQLKVLQTDIDDILVWDLERWLPWMRTLYDITGGEDLIQWCRGGITHDNTPDGDNGPTDETVAEGVFFGGDGAEVTGNAVNTTIIETVGEEKPLVEAMFDFPYLQDEENAVGEIAFGIIGKAKGEVMPEFYPPYQNPGEPTAHHLLTHQWYHAWLHSAGFPAACTLSLGMHARRMSIDVEELMYDRGVFLSILDALTIAV